MFVRFSRLFLPCVLATLVGCGGRSSTPPSTPPGAAPSNIDVYVAGSVYSSSPFYSQAVLWTNGKPAILPTTKYAVANAVALINGDVYVVGQQSDNSQSLPVVWINGTATVLNNGNLSGSATAIYYDGVHVWIAGYLYGSGANNQTVGSPVYWEDEGFAIPVRCSVPLCTATGIAVGGGHTYLTGNGYPNPGSSETQALAWEDGTEHILSGPPSAANGVALIKGTPYYVGTQVDFSGGNEAVYWQPLQDNPLQDGTQANGVATDGSSLYVAGNSASSAYEWTNLSPTQLPGDQAVANAISVVSGQTYTAGTVMQNGVATAGVWTGSAFSPLALPAGQKAAIIGGIATLNVDAP